MIIKNDSTGVSRAIDYIGDGKAQCFYLYADLLECGTEGENYGLWTSEENGELKGVAYRYYKTLHIYSRDVFPEQDALELISLLRPRCVYGPQSSVEPLVGKTQDEYDCETDYILTADQPLKCRSNLRVALATEEDIPDIVSVMMADPEFKNVYTYDLLYAQMLDRMRSGLGRIFIMRSRSGELLASSEINAETRDIMVTGAVIANQKYQGMGFGSALAAYTWNYILSSGKRPLGFVNVNNHAAVELDRRVGMQFSGTYSRLLRREQPD